MTANCPKGHTSTESDFCSECGAKIAGVAKTETARKLGETCPDCGTPRAEAGAKFCEICGYNYLTGAHGEIPMSTAASEEPAEPVTEQWVVQIDIDPSLKESGSPDPPTDWKPLKIAVDREELLIGRASKPRNIVPEIALDFDSAVSHRHAVLSCKDGKAWQVRDLESSNGTRVNGKDIQSMVDVPIEPGDRITVGHWTCLTVART